MNKNLDNYMIPKLLDAPSMILWIEADTAAIGASGLYMGFIGYALFDASAFVILVLSIFTIVLARIYSRIKALGNRGFISQAAYWYLPGSRNSRPIMPEIREYRG